MRADEFRLVVSVAKSEAALKWPEDYTVPQLEGCGLKDFVPTCCGFKQAVAFVRYQAAMFNGSWDEEEIARLHYAWVRCRRVELSDLTLPTATALWLDHVKAVLAA